MTDVELEIINTLLEFNPVHYRRLYLFLDSDERAYPFSCYAASVDVHFTLKHKNYPKNIYKNLCEHYITSWNLDPQLLLDVILGNEKINNRDVSSLKHSTQRTNGTKQIGQNK